MKRKIFMKLNYKSTNCTFLIFSVPGGTCEYFVQAVGTWGKDGWTAQYWTLFYYQLMHTMLKNAELLKHSKLDKNAPTCFGLHRNYLQGAKVSAWLKITCFSQALTLAPWRWFLRKPKHVGA